MARVRVAVGSRNPVKVQAVARVWRLICDADIIPVDVESGVARQPVGLDETFRGALNRAVEARKRVDADYGVGIEAGLVKAPTPTGWVDVQIAVIVDRGGIIGVGLSPAFEPPRAWLEELLKGTELGEVASRELGRPDIGKTIGLIGYLTRGVITRLDLTYHAVLMAAIPLLTPTLYPRSLKKE